MTNTERKHYRRQIVIIMQSRELLDKVAKAYNTSAAHIAVRLQTYLELLADKPGRRYPFRHR